MQQLRRVLILGGLFVLIGAGCQAGTTEDQVLDSSDSETFSDQESVTENTNENDSMELAHPGVLEDERIQNKQVRLKTNKGDIVFRLYPETAPLTVSNFVYLAEQGFYDGLIFHRVVEGFVIQGGDPLGTGTGGPGYRFEDELGPDHIPEDLQKRMEDHEESSLYQQGIVAMANAGPDTNGSQFFIMLEDIAMANMPNLYNIFGEVTEGIDIVQEIEQEDVMEQVIVEDIPDTE